MIKKTAVALALLLSVACASKPMTSSTGATSFSHPSDAGSYILLDYPNQVRVIDYGKTISGGLYVYGYMGPRGFVPVGNVEGKGTLCTSGQDWLNLSELTVHKSSEGKTPTAPYVLGCATSNGFQPSSRSIVMQ